MKIPLAFLLLAALPALAADIKYDVIFDQRTFLRPETDNRCCVWTDDAALVAPLLATLKIKAEAAPLANGGIVAVFFYEKNLPDKLGAITQDAAGKILAKYEDTGIMFKLMAPPDGMKYAHATAVQFTPPKPPAGFAIAGVEGDAPSEKFTGK